MGRVRNWMETRLSVLVRSLGFHRMEARSWLGLVARVGPLRLAHNLIRSRVLLKMAGDEDFKSFGQGQLENLVQHPVPKGKGSSHLAP